MLAIGNLTCDSTTFDSLNRLVFQWQAKSYHKYTFLIATNAQTMDCDCHRMTVRARFAYARLLFSEKSETVSYITKHGTAATIGHRLRYGSSGYNPLGAIAGYAGGRPKVGRPGGRARRQAGSS
jgi:hypothetical protein